MNGFINVLKPVGATASDCVVCIKHALKQKKVGHLGTLDPGAAGVLPVAVGSATKLFDLLTNKIKVYRAFFTFGKTTDTLDSYGVVSGSGGSIPSDEDLRKNAQYFVGSIDQIPPMYSALSVGGVRAYKLAREGVELQLKSRKITAYSFDYIRQESADTFVFDIKCSGGTYIRSLARDLADACGTIGYMSGLIRLQSGCFLIENAFTLDEIRDKKQDCVSDIMYPLSDLPSVDYSSKYFKNIDFGQKVVPCDCAGYHKVYCDGVFFGVGKADGKTLDLQYYLKNSDKQ